SSSSGAWPEIGSSAPFTQASWWLPRMIHSSGAPVPGMRAITSYNGLRLQSDLTRRCTFAGPGPTWYVIPSPPRHSSGAVGPASAASSGWASPYEIGSTGILVIVCASAVARRFASLVAPTPGVLARRRVARQRRLLQLRHELGRRDQLHHALFGRGKQNVERLDLRVEPEALELREDPFGVGLVVRRADVVRSRREVTHVLAQRVGARDRAELGFPLPLDLRRIGRVAAQVAGGGGGRGEDEH